VRYFDKLEKITKKVRYLDKLEKIKQELVSRMKKLQAEMCEDEWMEIYREHGNLFYLWKHCVSGFEWNPSDYRITETGIIVSSDEKEIGIEEFVKKYIKDLPMAYSILNVVKKGQVEDPAGNHRYIK
jgi:hypothetical protein